MPHSITALACGVAALGLGYPEAALADPVPTETSGETEITKTDRRVVLACVIREEPWDLKMGAYQLSLSKGPRDWVLVAKSKRAEWMVDSPFAAGAVLSPDSTKLILWWGATLWIRRSSTGELLHSIDVNTLLSPLQKARRPLACAGQSQWATPVFSGSRLQITLKQYDPPPHLPEDIPAKGSNPAARRRAAETQAGSMCTTDSGCKSWQALRPLLVTVDLESGKAQLEP